MVNLLLVSSILTAATAATAGLAYKGVDWSSTIVEEKAGKSWSTTSGKIQSLESILAASGVSAVRQRIWVTDGDYGLGYNVALARRARAAGLGVYLDFHYSETWADPSKQATPAAWANYSIGDLKYAVYNYTKDTMNAFQKAGVRLDLVSIGNEIRNGLLFPLGDFAKSPSNVAQLLHAASYGIKDSNIAPQPKIMIHLDNGYNYSQQQNWYDSVLGAGALKSCDFDVQGVSYYPFYNPSATLANLNSTLTSMKAKYGKELQVVETDWPTYCPSPEYAFPADAKDIPFSAAGQTTWMQKVAQIVSDVGGTGLWYWEPAWIDNAALGSSCPDTIMVDENGKALSSLGVFNSI